MSGVSIAFLLVRQKWSCFSVAAVPSFVKKKKEKEKKLERMRSQSVRIRGDGESSI